MRLTDLKEGVPKTLGIGVEIEIHQEKMKELYSRTLRNTQSTQRQIIDINSDGSR